MIRVALLTHGLHAGGGVPTVARWLQTSLNAVGGYAVDIHDLATSSRDVVSRRAMKPSSWFRSSLHSNEPRVSTAHSWGANAVEFEFMRYHPRAELTAALRKYDLIQVVAGSPAWAGVAAKAEVPIILQAATRAVWERHSQAESWPATIRTWRRGMTWATTRLEDQALRNASAVLVENSSMLDYVKSLGQKSAFKAPPGVDTQLFVPHSDGWQSQGSILSVCRLGDRRKGVERIVRAYAYLRDRLSCAPKLILAGRGSLPQPSRDLIGRLGLADTTIVRSNISASELPGLYRSASVFVQGSYEEGLGLSVLEAMASGLPVVSTETHGSRESIAHGVTGLLVSQEVENEVAKNLAGALHDALVGRGGAMGEAGRQRCVEQFSSAVTLRRFLDMYDALAKRPVT